MNYLPYPNVGEDPLWDLCAKQCHDIIVLQVYGRETKFDDCGEGQEIDFVLNWGFTPCWDYEELFMRFWKYYLDLQNY